MSDHEDETLAEVLIRHQRIPLFDGTRGQRCVGCDDLHGETDGPNSPRHAKHLAQVILASDWLAARDARVAATARAERDDRLICCPECRSVFEAEDDTLFDADAVAATARADAWDEGYVSGHSNAMRRMSDEPNAPTSPNPYRAATEDPS